MDGVCTIVNFYVCLERFLNEQLTAAVFHLDDDLEGKLLQGRDLVTKIAGVLINWDPNAHGMCLYQTIERIDVQSFVNVSLKAHDILNTAIFVPVLHFVVKPAILFQNFEAFFTSEKLRNEYIHIICLHCCRIGCTSLSWTILRHTSRQATLILSKKLLLLKLIYLHFDQTLDILRLK
jgi:hypothetical protein